MDSAHRVPRQILDTTTSRRCCTGLALTARTVHSQYRSYFVVAGGRDRTCTERFCDVQDSPLPTNHWLCSTHACLAHQRAALPCRHHRHRPQSNSSPLLVPRAVRSNHTVSSLAKHLYFSRMRGSGCTQRPPGHACGQSGVIVDAEEASVQRWREVSAGVAERS